MAVGQKSTTVVLGSYQIAKEVHHWGWYKPQIGCTICTSCI